MSTFVKRVGRAAALLAALFLRVASLAAQEESAEGPLQDIAADMSTAASHLAKTETGEPPQTAEQSAIKKLDVLIAELEKQCAACKNGRVKANSSKPAADSTIRSGPGGSGKLLAERRDGKQWGELPARERERILQSLNEGFPSHYQKILERYFTRLAEEKPPTDLDAASPSPAAPSPTAPSSNAPSSNAPSSKADGAQPLPPADAANGSPSADSVPSASSNQKPPVEKQP